MRKTFFIASILIGICFVIFLSIIFILINPDRFKPLITSQIEKYSGCQLTISDHLAFSFFPYFGVKTKHIQIVIPQESQTSLIKMDLKNIIVQIKLLPILQGKYKMGAIQIEQLTLHQPYSPLPIQLRNIQLKASATNKLNSTFLTMLAFDIENNLPLSSNANKTLHLTINGDISIDLKQQKIIAKNLNVALPGLTIGTLDIHDIHADIDLSANKQSFSMQSHLQIKNIKIAALNIDDIKCGLNFKNNIFNLETINANLYGGSLIGNATIHLNSFFPMIATHIKILNIQVEPLLKTLEATHGNIHTNTMLFGTGNIALDVSADVENIETLVNSLNGTSQVSVANGVLVGNDWDDAVTKLVAAKNTIGKEIIAANLHVFRFKQLSGTFKINNGVISGDDLLMESAYITIKGNSRINLANNLIDCELRVDLPPTRG